MAKEKAQMTQQRGIVLDANMLIRAIFGKRVRRILESTGDAMLLCCPNVCFEEAAKYLPSIAKRRGSDSRIASEELEYLDQIVGRIEKADYRGYRQFALDRIAKRDANDWPVVAVALMLQLPIWTEDQDFFGIGIPTWTTDLVELYLSE